MRESRGADGCALFLGRVCPLLSGLNLETGEIAFGAWTDPKGHAARGITQFEIIHNQTGLAGAVDIQAGLRAFDRDAVAGPDTRLEVYVTLVFLRRLLAGHREAEFRVRAVLRGMIAADLIIGSAGGGTQVDVLVLAVLKTEGDSNETARVRGPRGGTPRHFHLYRAVVKGGPLHDRVCLTISNLAIFGNL